MSLTIQRGFWQNKVLADTKTKLAELYHKEPEIAKSEKRLILEFWDCYEGLSSLLGDKWPAFMAWFMKTTSTDTITRCFRALKEDGTITLSSKEKQNRKKNQEHWRAYWSQQKQGKGAEDE